MDELTAYLAGEIHSDWRDRLRALVDAKDLPADVGAVTVETLEQAAEVIAYIFE